MADTGLKSPASTGEDHNQWTNPTNAYASDNARATENVAGERQDYYDFTFNIPAGATIDGIELKGEAIALVSEPTGWVWELSWDGGTTYTGTGFGSGEFIDSVDRIYTYGGATNKWGRGSWTDSELSNTNFRARVEFQDWGSGGTTALDHLQIRVYYTAASSTKHLAILGVG